jgi:hypothetical protein
LRSWRRSPQPAASGAGIESGIEFVEHIELRQSAAVG